MGCPQRRALRGGAAEDRDATKHHDGAEESTRAKVTCAQRLRRAARRAAPSFDGAADGGCADQEGTLKGVGLKSHLRGGPTLVLCSSRRGRSGRPNVRTNRGMVLVVDDDASVRKALRRLFHATGRNVETFASAAEFLAYDLPP